MLGLIPKPSRLIEETISLIDNAVGVVTEGEVEQSDIPFEGVPTPVTDIPPPVLSPEDFRRLNSPIFRTCLDYMMNDALAKPLEPTSYLKLVS